MNTIIVDVIIMLLSIGGLLSERSADVNIIPFGYVSQIEYKKELSGESKQLVQLGKLSAKRGGVTLVGALSDNHGNHKTSVFIFEGGRLAMISDMNEGTVKNSPAYGLNTFIVHGIKFGVLVGEDMYDCDGVKALSLCGCSVIIDLYADLLCEMNKKATDFYAYVYGLDFVCAGQDLACFSVAGGGQKIIDVKKGGVFNLSCKRLFREVRCKKSGSR